MIATVLGVVGVLWNHANAIAPHCLDGKAWVDALLGDDLVVVRARVRPADVVYVKGVLEASEGLGSVFAEPRSARSESSPGDGGEIVIAGPRSRFEELSQTIRDLRDELDVLEIRDGG